MVRAVREAVLWIGAVLGVLCLGWALVMVAAGLTPLVFVSGSMSPTIAAGDLAFARTVEAERVKVGDVVSVTSGDGARITHRVAAVERTDAGVSLTLKGDANARPDAEPYVVDMVERVAFSVPRAGYVVNAVSSPLGMFAGGLLVASALFVAFGRRHDPSDGPSAGPVESPAGDDADGGEGGADRSACARRVGSLIAGTIALAAAGSAIAVQPTWAAWSDAATVTTGTLDSTMASPANVTCSGGGLFASTITLHWAHLDPRYDYRVVTRDSSNGVLATIDVAGSGSAGTEHTAVISRSGGLGLFWYDRTATVMSKLKTSPTWLSIGTVHAYREGRIIAGSSIYCE